MTTLFLSFQNIMISFFAKLYMSSVTIATVLQEHSVKCRSLLQHRHNSVILTEDINSLAKKLIMIFRNIR
jgi:hypothetical protein